MMREDWNLCVSVFFCVGNSIRWLCAIGIIYFNWEKNECLYINKKRGVQWLNINQKQAEKKL